MRASWNEGRQNQESFCKVCKPSIEFNDKPIFLSNQISWIKRRNIACFIQASRRMFKNTKTNVVLAAYTTALASVHLYGYLGKL